MFPRSKKSWLHGGVKRVQRTPHTKYGQDYYDDDDDDDDYDEDADVPTRRERLHARVTGRTRSRGRRESRGTSLFDNSIGDVVEGIYADIEKGDFKVSGEEFLKEMGNVAAKGVALTIVMGVGHAVMYGVKALMGRIIFI